MVGVDAAKELFYARLKIDAEGPGFCHFPDDASTFDEEFFSQLTAEQQITITRNGLPERVWRKRRDRNEALDLRVYAMAALERIKPNFPLIASKIKRKAEREKAEPTEDTVTLGAPLQSPKPQPSRKRFRPRSGGWINSWK
jgi:phage terminase large subunit GpA-like protein